MIVVLTEKPSVAKTIAKILGAFQKNEGYYENNGYIVTYVFGHMLNLSPPSKYVDYNVWEVNTPPVFPDEYFFEVEEDKLSQFKIIEKLFLRNDTAMIVNATDAGREGEAIFRRVYNHISGINDIPAKRLWIKSMTESAITDGFKNLKPLSEFNYLHESSMTRACLDWVIGINATTKATAISGSDETISLGRVQTPTFGAVTQRFINNKNFVSTESFSNSIILEKDDIVFKATNDITFDDINKAKKLLEIKNFSEVTCILSKNKKIKEKTPLPLDLLTLQVKANKLYKYTAASVLTIAQSLYEKGYISYPRTDSRYITEDMMPNKEFFDVILSYKDFLKYNNSFDFNNLSTTCVNDKKVSDHHGLIPTLNLPTSLDVIETNIYELILKQYLAAFSTECIKESTNYNFEFISEQRDSLIFKTNGIIILELGWREILKDNKKIKLLPKIKENDIISVKKIDIDTHKTVPPPIFTDGLLLKFMETCGKEFNENVSKEIKIRGIGTPATRSGIIETCFNRGYLVRDGNNIIPSEKGLKLYNILNDCKLFDVDITGEWEEKLIEVEKGNLNSNVLIKNIEDFFMSDILPNLKKLKDEFKKPNLKCPKCKENSIKSNNKSYYCLRYKETENPCDFSLWRVIAKKNISDKILENLILQGKSKEIKGFLSKAGKKFNASLYLDKKFKIQFKFK